MTLFICHNASDRIRGELTRFLFEIDAGIYIGQLSAEVRKLLFKKVESISYGIEDFRMIMIYNYKNENGFLFEYLNYKDYKLEEFDGLFLPVYIKSKKDDKKI